MPLNPRTPPEGEKPRPSLTDLVRQLVVSSDRLGDEAKNIYDAATISKGIRSFFAIALGALIFMGLVNGWQVYELRQANNSSRAISKSIQDCTQPNGQCYQDARNNRDSNLNYNKEVVIAAVECATRGLQEAALRSCIEDSLKKVGVKQ